MLADWESSLELLETSNGSNNSTDQVWDGFLGNSSLELLESRVEDQESLIFIVDASKESIKAEVSTVGLNNTSEHLSGLNGAGSWHNSDWLNSGWLFSEDGLGGSHTNLLTEGFPLGTFVIGDSGFNLLEDILSVDHEVFTNVVSECGWAAENLNHLFELAPVSGEVGAVGHTALDGFQEIGEFFHTGDDFISTSSFEVLVSVLGVTENVLGIGDAGVDIIKSFGLESTLEDTLNDLDKLDSIKFNFFLSS